MQIDRFSPLRKPARRRRAARNQEHRASAEIETVEQRCLLSAVVTGPSGTVDTATPTITWSAMDGATSYDLWISEVTPEGEKLLDRPMGLIGTSYTSPALPDGTIRVWVRTNMADGSKTPWSAPHDFEVDAEPAKITGPVGKVATATPEITWDSTFGAVSYDLWISQIDAAPRNVLETPTGLTGFSYTPAPLPEGRIRVWVRASLADGSKTPWSAFHDFEVDVPAEFTSPSVVGGENPNLNTSTPTLEWTAAAGNQRFEIFLSDKSRVTSRVIQIYDATRRSYTFPDSEALGLGQYEAFIRAVSLDGKTDDWGAPIRFRVGTAPEILRPMAPSFQNPVVLEWDPVKDATGYDVFLSDADTLGAELHKADNVQGTSYKLPMVLPDGGAKGYTFWVRARHDGEVVTLPDGSTTTGASNVGLWSDPANFNTLKKPVLEPIPGGFTTAPFPTIRWSAVDKAARYDLWIDWSAGPAQYVRMNVRDTEYTFETKIPEGRFFVWVRAVSERGEFTEWSDPIVFEASGGIPVITGPTGVINDPFPTITWIGITDAVSYEVWISDDTTITPIIQQTGITTEFYEVNDPLAEGKYRVWVRATLLDGTVTNWTKPFGFEISTIVSADVPLPKDAGEIIPVGLEVEVAEAPAWLERSTEEPVVAESAAETSEPVVAADSLSEEDRPPVSSAALDDVQLMYVPEAASQDAGTDASSPLELQALDQLVSGWHQLDWWSNAV